MTQAITLRHINQAQGTVKLPGSKSISNRALLLAAVSSGVCQIDCLLDSDDTRIMRTALDTLGIQSQWNTDATQAFIHGCAGVLPAQTSTSLSIFLGNAGTAARPLTAMLAVLGGHFDLHGVPRMHERPIGDLVDALRQWHGAGLDLNIHYREQAGFPPLSIQSQPHNNDHNTIIRMKGNTSSQFVSAMLMAAPLMSRLAEQTLVIEGELISRPYVEMTLRLMADFGVQIATPDGQTFVIAKGSHYQSPTHYRVEGDASSASYFLALGAIAASKQQPLRIEGVGSLSIQGDVAFVDALRAMGGMVEIGNDYFITHQGEPTLKSINWDCTAIPDAAMTLAVLALFARGTTTLRGIASWRVKETDRISAMANELRKFGAHVETTESSIAITPSEHLPDQVRIKTYDDHRMAMCFSLASCLNVSVEIEDPNCVSKTFPTYFEVFSRVTH